MIQITKQVLKDTLGGFRIPPKPSILKRIDEIVNGEDPSISDVADCIAEDVGISSAILKVINSPFYGMNRTVSDVRQAVFILGIQPVRSLVTAMKLKKAFNSDCCISLDLFWDNAVEIANTMVFIGSKLENKIPPEDLYTLGLFHDAGIPAMACKYPDYVEVLKEANDSMRHTLVKYEERKYPTNHAIVGFYLANSWHLPKNLCRIILNHHEMDFFARRQLLSEHPKLAVLKLAENIVFYNKRMHSIPEWDEYKDTILGVLLLDDDELDDMIEDLSVAEF